MASQGGGVLRLRARADPSASSSSHGGPSASSNSSHVASVFLANVLSGMAAQPLHRKLFQDGFAQPNSLAIRSGTGERQNSFYAIVEFKKADDAAVLLADKNVIWPDGTKALVRYSSFISILVLGTSCVPL